MRATALGTSAAYPGAGNACTGWLIQEEDTNLLLDCGTGILANLQHVISLPQLTAVVISHMHADHFIDLIPLRYAFKYGMNQSHHRPLIFLPPGGLQILESVGSPLESNDTQTFFRSVFDVSEYDPSFVLSIGSFAVSFAPGAHYVPSWAIAVQGKKRIVYTGDTGPNRAVTELAAGANLLITEATYESVSEENGQLRGHLTAEEAGLLAAEANPSTVLITHLWPHQDPVTVLAHAQKVFHGEISVAVAGKTYKL